MKEHSESCESESEEGKSESYANEARERHREVWISAATTLFVNITMTCRQSGVISLTHTARGHQNSVRGSALIPELSEGAVIKTVTKHRI